MKSGPRWETTRRGDDAEREHDGERGRRRREEEMVVDGKLAGMHTQDRTVDARGFVTSIVSR